MYADLPKYFLAYLNLSCMYGIYSCTQWLLRVKGKHLGATINIYAPPTISFVFILGYGDDYHLVTDVLQRQDETRDLLSNLVGIEGQSLEFQRQTVLAMQDMAVSIREGTEAFREAVLALKDISVHK